MVNTDTKLTEANVWTWLEEVKDPEIPVLSLVDLGVITALTLEGNKVKVEMTPTFTGCPALDYMKSDILEVLEKQGLEAEVIVTFRQPWSSDRITEKGKKALKEFGFAPPPPSQIFTDLEILENAQCPRCDSLNTDLKNPFGPTLCRAIYYCQDCKETFEQFKPI